MITPDDAPAPAAKTAAVADVEVARRGAGSSAPLADSAESAQHAPSGRRFARPAATPRTDVDVEL